MQLILLNIVHAIVKRKEGRKKCPKCKPLAYFESNFRVILMDWLCKTLEIEKSKNIKQ